MKAIRLARTNFLESCSHKFFKVLFYKQSEDQKKGKFVC